MVEPLANICKRILYNERKYTDLCNRSNKLLFSDKEKLEETHLRLYLESLCHAVLGGNEAARVSNIATYVKGVQHEVMKHELAAIEIIKKRNIMLPSLNQDKKEQYLKIHSEMHKILLEIQKDLGKFRITLGA